MKKYIYRTVVACSLVGMVGCVHQKAPAPDKRSARTLEIAQMNSAQITQLRQQLNTLQDQNNQLVKTVNSLNQKVGGQTIRQNKLAEQMNGVQSDLNAETRARKMETQRIIAIVKKESRSITSAISRSNQQSNSSEVIKHKVQAGETLAAIAKAYSRAYHRKITVQAIKKANRLRSDIIRVGQKLIIP
jgi:LysM repeat protein